MKFRYHNDMKIVTTSGRHAHLSVSNHVWGSKLKIRGVYTLDSGLYRCEASNGLRRVHTSAYLTISFRKYIFPALSCGFECAAAEILHHRTPAGMGNRGKKGAISTPIKERVLSITTQTATANGYLLVAFYDIETV